MNLPPNTALVIVDVQRAIEDPSWAIDGPRNNPDAEANIAALLAAWRRIGYPIFHVRHDGTLPTSTYRPGQPENEFKPEAAPLPGETIIVKHTNSAFIGTEFERLLRQSRIYTLVIMGVITNNSLEATVRMSGNLGFAPMRPPAGSFLGGFRTPAPVPADSHHGPASETLHRSCHFAPTRHRPQCHLEAVFA